MTTNLFFKPLQKFTFFSVSFIAGSEDGWGRDGGSRHTFSSWWVHWKHP